MPTFPELNFRRAPVTLTMAAVAVALEIVCTLDPPRRLDYYNASLGILPYIWTGQVWRPLTTTLLHGGLLHAVFNLYWLVRFGSPLEARFGSFRFALVFVLLSYMSMLPQFIVSTYNSPPVMIVGLSGVIYGLLGILIIGRRRHPELNAVCDAAMIQFMLFWLVLCILLTRMGMLPVANIAHAGGLVFGLLYGLVIFDAQRRVRWVSLASVATILVLSTLIACPGHAGYEALRQQRLFWEQIRAIPAAPQQDEGS
jgi:membrane associated rhomboid family serine protease